MKLAYFSPLPPERSGIADYSALLLPALRKRIDVRVARRGSRRALRRADVALYHIGNNAEAHDWIVEALRRRSGIVVLHDLVLHHLVAAMTRRRGDGRGYLDAMEREAGTVGRLLAHGVIDGLLPPLWETRPEDFPLVGWVLDSAEGVVVHSSFVEQGVRDAGFQGPVWRIPMPAWPAPGSVRDPELPSGRRPLIGCFGHFNTSKRIPQVLEAFARLRAKFPDALLVLAGSGAESFGLSERLEHLGLRVDRDVLLFDYVRESDLWGLILASDVIVNLRSPTMGETSGMVIRALSLGKPVVVSDVGWFSELPDSVVAKVPVDEWEIETLAAVLELLGTDEDIRRRMGAAALAYGRSEHDVERVAELYVAAAEESAGGASVTSAVLSETARAAYEVGIRVDDPEVGLIATRLREAGFGD